MKNIIFKIIGENIIVEAVFNTLQNLKLGIYQDNHLINEGEVNEEEKKISFKIGFSFDNTTLNIREIDTQTILTYMKIHCNTSMGNHNFIEKVVQDDWSEGEPFYEVDVVKPPPTVMPPPKKDETIYIDTVEELHNFIHNGDYDRGFNEGFLIGKSL